MARSTKNSAWNEVFAIILLLTGTLLFFALISYSPRDLPSWVPWSYLSPPNRPAQNFIGPFGAIFASIFYLLIGAASYFLAAVLLGFGAAKLFYPRLRVLTRLPWIVLFLLSGACLLQLQTRYFFEWKKLNIQGPGGSIGYFFGKKLLLGAMGDVGSMILLAGIYLSALILMTGLRPIHLVRETVGGIRNSVVRFRQWRLRREMRRADIKGQLAISERELAKQRRLIEKQLKKKGASVPERTVVPPAELVGRPKPKVVDTTALPEDAVLPPRKKPSLAELQPSKVKAPIKMTEARKFDAERYVLPSIDLLDEHDPESRGGTDLSELEKVQEVLIETLGQFGIAVAAGDITKGPTITRYEVYPAKGVRVDKIVSLERDLARATRAERINILAPIPGKDTVGIEIANTRKIKVTLRELMQSADWEDAKKRCKIPLTLGKDVYGNVIKSKPNLVVCWGGHSIGTEEYQYTKKVGYELGLRGLDVCTGCGPGAMKGPMKGATIGHAKQRIVGGRYIGLTEPGIIAAEPPNPIVNQLVIMPDIEKRLEAFVRLSHGIVVFPGGVGTAEEILYLLGILLEPANAGTAPESRAHRAEIHGRVLRADQAFHLRNAGRQGGRAPARHRRRPGRGGSLHGRGHGGSARLPPRQQ